ncbi:BnaA09g41540D [Brassica napus]|uniref:BnaA09g41540D protein n=3 Tax=Brassica TaxID=3705 RepID=A0A078HAL5_BRANA|nr:BnaA09g41540D [Brassica napus]
MDVSRRYEDLLERILVKYEEKLDEHQGNECIDAFLADENAEYRITRKNIKALLAELFFGAGDSSASTTQWAMAEIINNPNILESLRVVGKKRLVQETDLPKLPYLQAVINETLRMHPVGAVFPREFQQECTIGGFYIAKGTTLVINAYGVMRDPDYWEDPNKFKPERFLASSGSSWQEERREQAMKFLPFGGGRRRCPGSNVAYIIVGTAIGVMVQCFDWKIKRGYEVNMEETSGLKLFLALAHPLECIPLSRTLNPLPTNLQITDL